MQAGLAGAALGAGGLRTAHRLHQYGRASTVYEANIRIGGRMYSNSDDFTGGRVVEWGGELISTEHTSLRNLAHQLNLELEDANKSSVGEEEVYLIDGEACDVEHWSYMNGAIRSGERVAQEIAQG